MENKKTIPYLDKSYTDKRRILREYSIKEEIRESIETVADDLQLNVNGDIIHDSNIKKIFKSVVKKLNFEDISYQHSIIKDFLIDGIISIEMIWDQERENIINFSRLNASSLVPSYDKTIGSHWIQYPDDYQLKRILINDTQLININYSEYNDYSETSYVEGLIKSFNQLKILEQTKIMLSIANATVYQKFTIPVRGLAKQKAEDQIGQLITNYSENIEWDDTIGTLTINGAKHLPYNKQVWFPDCDLGTANMELLKITDNSLNNNSDMETLYYFKEKLRKASKIPNMGDIAEEKKYKSFILRTKNKLKEIILKPFLIEVKNKYPSLYETVKEESNKYIC